MEEQEFKRGDVVYHKVNGLKMVVIDVYSGNEVSCRYINAAGIFSKSDFFTEELSPNDISTPNETLQLESKNKY